MSASSPGPREPVTLRSVAARAGVSMGTASQALSGRGAVSDAARERVLAAADELGYVVNRVAQSLRRRASRMIGVVVPEVSNPFFAELIGAIERACDDQGLAVLFAASASDGDRELEHVIGFRERQVDGLLLIGAGRTAEVEAQLPRGFPVVAVDRVPRRWSHDRVGVDSRAGCKLAVEHLVSLGHRRLAYLGAGTSIETAAARRQHTLAAARSLGATVIAGSDGEFTFASGIDQAQELLAQGGADRPTAFVAANDLLALGAIEAARQRGVRVPEELSVVGFDDNLLAGLARPQLTTVRQPVERIAALAVAALLARVESPRRRRVEALVEPELVVRASSAAAPR